MVTIMDRVFRNDYFLVIVSLLIVLAFLLRYWHAAIGLPYVYYWDEPQTASTALQMMKTGDLNPNFFSYGSLMIYLNLLVDKIYYLYLTIQDSESISLQDIKTRFDAGWHWTISHPEFYFWNRVLTALLGTATVVVTYLLGKHIFNKWVGLIAAAFLATLPIHVDHSAMITTDVPVALFISCVVLFAVLFVKTERKRYFVSSLVFVGLAVATKYNAGLSLLVPLVSLLWVFLRRKNIELNYCILFCVVPALVFIIVMPYAILDINTFINDVLRTMRHYSVIGHKGNESAPGWDHFSFQMINFYQNIGVIGVVLVLIGFVGVVFRPLLALAVMLPVVYIFYMSGLKVNFHRNFIQVYPFIAILIGSGFYYINHTLRNMIENFNGKYNISAILSVVLVTVFLGKQAYGASVKALDVKESKDSRTEVIDILNGIDDVEYIVIAKELRIHERDLQNLEHEYSIVPLELIGSLKKENNTVYVLPQYIDHEISRFSLELAKKQAVIDLAESSDAAALYLKMGDSSITYLDRYSINPALAIYREIPDIEPDPSVIALDNCTFSSDEIKLTEANLLIFSEGEILTPSFDLDTGEYSFNLDANRVFYKPISNRFEIGGYKVSFTIEKEHNIGTDIYLDVSIYDSDDGTVIASSKLKPSSSFTTFRVPFTLSERRNIRVKLEYLNETPGSVSPRMYIKSLSISTI